MEEKQDPIFADGIIFKKPRENAPDFIKGHLAIKVDEAVEMLKKNEKKGWVNIDLKKSKGGKLYLQVDTWEPGEKDNSPAAIDPDTDIPF